MNRGPVKIYSNLALLCTAIISGLSFVAQKASMEFVGPFTFNSIRAFLGALSLLPIIAFLKAFKNDFRTDDEKIFSTGDLQKAESYAGVCFSWHLL